MSRLHSDESSEFHFYGTPNGSVVEGENTRPVQSQTLDESSDGARVRNTAPPYTENAYAHKQGSRTTRQSNDTHRATSTIMDYTDARASSFADNASVANSAATGSSRRKLADSIKSYFRRNSQSSGNSKKDGEQGEGNEDEKKEEKEETPEEITRRMQDPQYLLNTILEEPETEGQDVLMPVGDAAVAVADSGASTNESDQQMAQRRKGYRENLMRTRQLRKYTKASKTIKFCRKWFNKFMEWSLLTRVFIYWLPLAIILFIPLGIGAWSKPSIELGHTRVMWIFIWLEVVWGSLWIAKIFARYLPNIYGFLMSIFLPRYFKYVNMVSALELAIQLVVWTFVTFISFTPILTDNRNALNSDVSKQPHWQKIVLEVCVALLVSAIVFFVEQVFVYILSTNFHRTRMSLRIQTQKKSIHVLIILLDAAFSFFPWRCDEFDEEDRGLQFAAFNRAQRKVGSKTKNAVIRNVNRIVGNAAKNVESMVAEARSNNAQPSCAKIVNKALTNRDTRELLANRIWKSLVMEDSNYLTYEDLITVFGKDRKEEVLFIFDILDRDGMNGIDLDEMVESVNGIGRESKQIQKSLVDIDGAITKLHYLLMCIALILIVVIFVGMLAPSSATVLATLGSTLLSMSFLFSATAQEVFQSCVFLFVKHPFDVGDWIQTSVPGIGLVRMRVVELNLMYSVFEQIGVNTRRQVSNAALTSAFIDNISRSPPSQISIVLSIGIPETTTDQLAEFETRLNEFVESNPRDYIPGVFFQAIDQPDLDRFSLNICINTRNNQDDIVLFSSRRTRALEYISQCINEIPIAIPRREDATSHDPALPTFHYKINSLEEAMDYVDKAKGKRQQYGMRPPSYDDDDSIMPNEEAVVTDGYQDGPTPGGVATGDDNSRAAVSVRRTSFSSRMSRQSRAYSTSSRASNNFGLRSRRQVPLTAQQQLQQQQYHQQQLEEQERLEAQAQERVQQHG